MRGEGGELRLAGRYTLQQSLAHEGRRRVWRAFDALFERTVVLKGVFAGRDEDSARQLHAEYHRLRLLSHHRLPRAYEVGWTEWVPGEARELPFTFFTLEWFPGPSLWDLRGRLSPESVHQCITQLLEVVAYLHQQRFVSLDLKPPHLIRTQTGWRLIDLDQARIDDPFAARVLHGTLPYLAPEVLSGEAGDVRSDLYSVGAVLLTALTGQPPALNGATLEALAEGLRTSPVPGLDPDLVDRAPALARLCRSLLERAPCRRPASALEALALLEDTPTGRMQVPLAELELVGREEAISRIERWASSPEQKTGGGLVLSGPSGSGRTRLLTELAVRWNIRGRPALLVRPDGHRGPPLGAVQRLLRCLTLLEGGASLSTGQLAPEPAGALRVAREDQLQRALRELCRLGSAVAERLGDPLPMLIDDLEQLDELSRRVIDLLCPLLPESGLLLFMARLELPGRGEVAADPTALPVVLLRPLAIDEVRSLAERSLGPGSLTAAELEFLHRSTDGVVGAVRQVLAARWLDPASPLRQPGAHSLDVLVGALERFLEQPVRQVLQSLSVLEHGFSLTLAAAMCADSPLEVDGETLERVTGAVATLAGAGLLEGAPAPSTGEPLFRFSQERVRRAVLAALPPDVRQGLHQRVAEVLEQRGALEAGASPRSIADQFLAAGLPARARPHLQRAVDEATRALLLEEAAGGLERLLELTPARSPDRGALLLRLGQLRSELGHHAEASRIFEGLITDGGDQSPAVRVRALAGLGGAKASLSQPREAAEALRAALAGAGETVWQSPEERVDWLLRLAWTHISSRELGRAREALEDARRESLAPGTSRAVDLARYEAWIGLEEGKPTHLLIPGLMEALALARQLGDHRSETNLLNVLVWTFQRAGDLESARMHMERAVSLARESYDLLREAVAVQNLGGLLRELGDVREALLHLERAVELHERLGNRAAAIRGRLAIADLLLDHGVVARAETLVLETAAPLTGVGPELEPARRWREVLEARLRLRLGRTEGLAERLEALEAALLDNRQLSVALSVIADRLELALGQQRWDEVCRIHGRLSAWQPGTVNRAAWHRIHALMIDAHRTVMTPVPADSARVVVTTATRDDAGTDASDENRAAREERSDREARPAGGSTLLWLERIKALLQVAEDEEALASELAALAGTVLGGRGLVLLFEQNRHRIVQGFRIQADQVEHISQTVLSTVRRTAKPFICADILAQNQAGQLRSLRESHVRSVVCCPVIWKDQCLGAVYVDHRVPCRVSEPQLVQVVTRVAELAGELLEAVARRRRQLNMSPGIFGLVGESPAMQRLRDRIRELCNADARNLVVLLLGETGTGKSAVARAIHEHGSRKGGPFVTVNCTAVTETMFEAEIFGYAKGAFTNALTDKPGFFGAAQGGTLFLDEIGEMPLAQQPRLLTALQDWRYTRLGQHDRTIDMNFHLFCATNMELQLATRTGRFRQDLYARIASNIVRVPTLRERGEEDIRLLIQHQLTRLVGDRPEPFALPPLDRYFSRQAESFLYEYTWPMNVRELAGLFNNVSIRQRILSGGREQIRLSDLRMALDLRDDAGGVAGAGGTGGARGAAGAGGVAGEASMPVPPPGLTLAQLQEWLRRIKCDYVSRVHRDCDNNISHTAKKLRCSRDAVYRFLHESGE